ncbi:uncharacterized protein [Antedon mediterranea]|uniref:uncharacterized protein isoform X2 n=1 Tax=Antedon mediterranea TaxID=105859 RepID=UPI003AF4A84A
MSNSTEATNNTSLTEALKFWPVYVVVVGGAIVGAILTVIKCFCPQRWKSLKEKVQCCDKTPNNDKGDGGVTDENKMLNKDTCDGGVTDENPDINLAIIPVESAVNEIKVKAEISINGGTETDPLLFADSDKTPNNDKGDGGVTDENPDINLAIIPVESAVNEIKVKAEISINGGTETDPLLFADSDKTPNNDKGDGGVTDENPDINLAIIPVESAVNEIKVKAEISINGGTETDPLLFADSDKTPNNDKGDGGVTDENKMPNKDTCDGGVTDENPDINLAIIPVESAVNEIKVPNDDVDASTQEQPYYQKTENPERERSVHQFGNNDLNRFPLTRVTEHQLNTFAGKLGSNWRSFIRNLGLTDVDMYQATGDSNMIVHEPIFKCLLVWKKRNGNKATVRELAKKCCENQIDIDAYNFLALDM